MTRECKHCGKEFVAKTVRAEFDSPACRKAFNRNNSVTPVTETTDDVTELVTEKIELPLSKTDALFQKDTIDRGLGEYWLAFSPITRSPKCDTCKKQFKTRLGLLRYCSPHCRREALNV